MGIECLQAVWVAHDDIVAIAALIVACGGHRAGKSGTYYVSSPDTDVYSAVHADGFASGLTLAFARTEYGGYGAGGGHGKFADVYVNVAVRDFLLVEKSSGFVESYEACVKEAAHIIESGGEYLVFLSFGGLGHGQDYLVQIQRLDIGRIGNDGVVTKHYNISTRNRSGCECDKE